MSYYNLGVALGAGFTTVITFPVFVAAFGQPHGVPEFHLLGACCGIIATGSALVSLHALSKCVGIL